MHHTAVRLPYFLPKKSSTGEKVLASIITFIKKKKRSFFFMPVNFKLHFHSMPFNQYRSLQPICIRWKSAVRFKVVNSTVQYLGFNVQKNSTVFGFQ